ncbi:uncharacterized protein METZ01_LOCUS145152, partial [marine metagenome]
VVTSFRNRSAKIGFSRQFVASRIRCRERSKDHVTCDVSMGVDVMTEGTQASSLSDSKRCT